MEDARTCVAAPTGAPHNLQALKWCTVAVLVTNMKLVFR